MSIFDPTLQFTELKESVCTTSQIIEEHEYKYLEKHFQEVNPLTFFKTNKQDESHTFLKLDYYANNNELSLEDRFLFIKYMQIIPYKNNIQNVIKSIQKCIDDYTTQNDKEMLMTIFKYINENTHYFYFHDEVLSQVYHYVFKTISHIEYPIEIVLESASYILKNGSESKELRFDVIDILLDYIECSQDDSLIYKCANIFIKYGELDEKQYGKQIINKIGLSEDVNLNNESLEDILKSYIIGECKFKLHLLSRDIQDSILSSINSLEDKMNVDDFLDTLEEQEAYNKIKLRIGLDREYFSKEYSNIINEIKNGKYKI